MTSTGILDELKSYGNVTVLLPPSMAESFAPYVPEGVQIKVARFDGCVSPLRRAFINFFGDILYLTFPHTDILPNATAEYHRQYHTSNIALAGWAAVQAGRLASICRPFRTLVRKIYQTLLPKDVHADIIKDIQPDLMVGCSFGLGLEDATFLAEAKHHSIKSATIVQTWDRSSNKGYPTLHPDYALVWSDIMKKDCLIGLEFKDEQVLITGSPLWDQHFNRLKSEPAKNWRSDLKIDPLHKVIFYACGELMSHDANLHIIEMVFEKAKQQKFAQDVHLVFRLYPLYLSRATLSGRGKEKMKEMEALLDRYRDVPNITITYPDFSFDGKNFLPNAGDHEYMTECLRQCDVSLSMVSSQMIEATILGKPAINLEYGLRESEHMVFRLEDYHPEHLLRIYRSGAIYRVHSDDELVGAINEGLHEPDARADQRKALIDQEAPVHRGDAAAYTAKVLNDIVCELKPKEKE